jgi:hypothetical protein
MRIIGNITNVEFEDIDYGDSPDFCDAHIVSADLDGVPMNEKQLEALNDDSNLRYELLMEHIY